MKITSGMLGATFPGKSKKDIDKHLKVLFEVSDDFRNSRRELSYFMMALVLGLIFNLCSSVIDTFVRAIINDSLNTINSDYLIYALCVFLTSVGIIVYYAKKIYTLTGLINDYKKLTDELLAISRKKRKIGIEKEQLEIRLKK